MCALFFGGAGGVSGGGGENSDISFLHWKIGFQGRDSSFGGAELGGEVADHLRGYLSESVDDACGRRLGSLRWSAVSLGTFDVVAVGTLEIGGVLDG